MARRIPLSVLLLGVACLAASCRGNAIYRPGDGVEIVLAGTQAYTREELLEVAAEDLRAFEEEGSSKTALDDAAWRIEEFLRAQGYPHAEVSYGLELEGRAVPRAEFQIRPGQRAALAQVHFPGASAFPADRLRAFVLAPRGFLRSRAPTTWYVESALVAARGEIEGLYVSQGFNRVRVDPPVPEFLPDGRVEVTIRITEGPRTVLTGFDFEGIAPDLLPAVQEALREHLDQPWYPRRAYALRAAVREVYADRGHPEARVELRLPPAAEGAAPTVALRPVLTVDPGPRVRIGEVRILGAQRTREDAIRARLRLAEGDLYRRARERESFTRLLGMGLFRRVELELVPRPDEDRAVGRDELRDLVVTLEELPARELFVEPGYGSYELLRLRAGAADRNVLGLGHTARAETSISQRAVRAELGYLWPALLGTELALDGRAFAGRREEPSFVREDVGTEWRLSRPITRHVRATLGYEFRQSSARDIDAALESAEDVLLSVLSLSPSFDTRDSLFWPARGTLARIKAEWSDELLGSQLDYVRLLGTLARYHGLSEPLVLAWAYRTGLIFPTGDTDAIPIQERFFNGGESSVRSFKESRLGPTDAAGEPLGGEAFNVLSVELRYRFARSWQAAFFADAGNVAARVDDWGRFSGLRYAVGAGLRWLLPIGPIRLDLGVNPDPAPGEDDYRLHFSVGSAF